MSYWLDGYLDEAARDPIVAERPTVETFGRQFILDMLCPSGRLDRNTVLDRTSHWYTIHIDDMGINNELFEALLGHADKRCNSLTRVGTKVPL